MSNAINCFMLEQTGREVTGEVPYGDGQLSKVTSPVWGRPDTGEEFILGHASLAGVPPAPPGAMWFADWYGDDMKGTDGKTLVVRTPGGDWIVDSGPWTRTGTPPQVTANPSILFRLHGYHGWLRSGQLVEC